MATPGKKHELQAHTLVMQLVNLDYQTTHIAGIHNEAPDMLSRNPSSGPPVDEELLEERLVGTPHNNTSSNPQHVGRQLIQHDQRQRLTTRRPTTKHHNGRKQTQSYKTYSETGHQKTYNAEHNTTPC